MASVIDWEDLTGGLAAHPGTTGPARPLRPWEDLSVIARGAGPAHAPIVSWPDRAAALAGGSSAHVRDLGGDWRALTCPRPEEVPSDAADPGFADGDWPLITVPGHPELQGRGIPIYTNIQYPFPPAPPTVPEANPTTVYRHRFSVPDAWAGQPLRLEFAGVDPWYRVWLDGRELGRFAGGSRNVADFILADGLAAGEHQLTVVVPRWAWTTYIEDQDQWWLSGIFRPVRLHLLDQARPVDWQIQADATGEVRWTVWTQGCAGTTVHAELCDGATPIAAVTGKPDAEGRIEFVLQAKNPRLWSAETPHLYRLLLRIDGSPAWYGQAVGFRSVRIEDGRLLINGAAVKLRGVNRHDFHPGLGRAIGVDEITADLHLMKRHGFNAVRTSHYPPQDAFFELCDALGLYVLAEADLESHGMREALAIDPAWRVPFVDRCERLVRRLRNCTCVIAWSLGNESGMGPNFEAAAAAVRAIDPNRPVQYHHAGTHAGMDWVTMHYPRLDQIRAFLADPTTAGRPVLLEEYAHAMGNAVGSLGDYDALIESEPRLIGGFIWEWIDHALWRQTEAGPVLAYGGDFGDKPNDGNFCVDGICSAERRVKPALAEAGQVNAPLVVRRSEDGRILVRSRRFHADCADLRLVLRLRADGRVMHEDEVDVPALSPGTEAELAVPPAFLQRVVSREALLEIVAVTRDAVAWAEAGTPLGVWQLPIVSIPPPVVTVAAVSTDAPRLTAAGVEVAFDQAAAQVTAISVHGRRLVCAVPGLILQRARLDNDGVFMEAWRRCGLDRMQRHPQGCRVEGGAVVLATAWRSPEGMPIADEVQRWSMDAAGRIGVTVRFRPAVRLPTLPRLGLRLRCAPDLATATWYGRGPHENLIDRCSAAWVGVHRCAVDALAEPYVRPQESGQRTGVRWWHLGGADGSGLAVLSSSGLTVCARRQAVEDLAAATHQEHLPRRPWIELILDHAHAGTGNTSLRAERMPWAQVPAEAADWHVTLAACSTDQAGRLWTSSGLRSLRPTPS